MNDLLERVTQGEVQVIMLSSQHAAVGLIGADGYEAGWHQPAKTMTKTLAKTMTRTMTKTLTNAMTKTRTKTKHGTGRSRWV